MHALREVHRVLAPGGLLVDTQPISPRPPVDAKGARLGTLDMRDWRATIDAIEEQVQRVLADGLFTLDVERSLVVSETFDNGPELVETVSNWQGTRSRNGWRARRPSPSRRSRSIRTCGFGCTGHADGVRHAGLQGTGTLPAYSLAGAMVAGDGGQVSVLMCGGVAVQPSFSTTQRRVVRLARCDGPGPAFSSCPCCAREPWRPARPRRSPRCRLPTAATSTSACWTPTRRRPSRT